MQMDRGLVVLLINRIYDESLPIELTAGKTTCIDQSIAGFENKQYVQDVTVSFEEADEPIFNKVLNQVALQFTQN